MEEEEECKEERGKMTFFPFFHLREGEKNFLFPVRSPLQRFLVCFVNLISALLASQEKRTGEKKHSD